MCLMDQIEEAGRTFDAWQHPWTFHDAVCNALDQREKQQFNMIWRAAVNEEHWLLTMTLHQGAVNAEKALSDKFPNLATDVIHLIVNGAAYEWK